jgi:hypothetical protein
MRSKTYKCSLLRAYSFWHRYHHLIPARLALKSTHIPPFNTHIPRPSLKNRIMFLEETARWPVKFSQGIEIQLIAEADEINGRHSYIFLTDRPTDRRRRFGRPLLLYPIENLAGRYIARKERGVVEPPYAKNIYEFRMYTIYIRIYKVITLGVRRRSGCCFLFSSTDILQRLFRI